MFGPYSDDDDEVQYYYLQKLNKDRDTTSNHLGWLTVLWSFI